MVGAAVVTCFLLLLLARPTRARDEIRRTAAAWEYPKLCCARPLQGREREREALLDTFFGGGERCWDGDFCAGRLEQRVLNTWTAWLGNVSWWWSCGTEILYQHFCTTKQCREDVGHSCREGWNIWVINILNNSKWDTRTQFTGTDGRRRTLFSKLSLLVFHSVTVLAHLGKMVH